MFKLECNLCCHVARLYIIPIFNWSLCQNWKTKPPCVIFPKLPLLVFCAIYYYYRRNYQKFIVSRQKGTYFLSSCKIFGIQRIIFLWICIGLGNHQVLVQLMRYYCTLFFAFGNHYAPSKNLEQLTAKLIWYSIFTTIGCRILLLWKIIKMQPNHYTVQWCIFNDMIFCLRRWY